MFFDKREVTPKIKAFLVNNLNAPKHLDSEQVLNAIEVQQGILVERARNTYSFSHLTFQEYLTAQHIVDNQQIEWLVQQHLTDNHWREVFLLVAGLMPGRKGADSLLRWMEQQANSFLNTDRLKALVRWAQNATEGSEGNYKPAAKRVGAIALALTRDLDHVLARVLARVLDAVLSLARVLSRILSRALDLDLDHVLNRDLAHEFQKIEIFKSIDWADLIQRLETLQSEISDAHQPAEVRRAFVQRVQNLWFDALQLDPEVATLSAAEVDALSNYFSANQLMVRCQEAAVRVSAGVWAGIEERMLTVQDAA